MVAKISFAPAYVMLMSRLSSLRHKPVMLMLMFMLMS